VKHFQNWLGKHVASVEHMFAQADIENLALLAQGRDTIIEVGCYQGAMTRIFTLFAQEVHSVDWFKGDWAAGEFDENAVFEAFCMNNREALDAGKLHVYRMSSDEGAASLATRGVTADLIWIDADHDYEHCSADIRNYLPLLKPGGVMCGHDVATFEGVTRAVDEAFDGQALYHPNTLWSWQDGRPAIAGCDLAFRVEAVPTLVMETSE
jgi:predicted O-methyltransferase YrrM